MVVAMCQLLDRETVGLSLGQVRPENSYLNHSFPAWYLAIWNNVKTKRGWCRLNNHMVPQYLLHTSTYVTQT